MAQAHRGEDDRAGRLEQAHVEPLPRLRRDGRSRSRARGRTALVHGVGLQTAVDAGKSGYSGTENDAHRPRRRRRGAGVAAARGDVGRSDQSTQALDAIRLAACQPHVTAYFNFLLADEPRARGLAVGRLLGRPDAEGLLARLRAGDRRAATAGTVDCDALKGGRPSADFLPPNAPSGLNGVAVAEPLRVDLVMERRRGRRRSGRPTASSGMAPTSARPRPRAGRT